MYCNKKSGSEDVERLFEVLQLYEQQILNLTASIESQNEENARIETSLVDLVHKKIGGGSPSPPVLENSVTSTRDGEFSLKIGKVQEEIEATRQSLQKAQKNEELAGTALTRIANFIMHNDEKYKHYLDGLRELIQCFQNVWSMSEEHNTKLKVKLKMNPGENPLNASTWSFGEARPQRFLPEEKLAPYYVEVTRTVAPLLNCMTAILDSLKMKSKLCLINRKCLEEGHQRVKSQLFTQRDVLKDVRHTVNNMEAAILSLQLANNAQKGIREKLQQDLVELDSSLSLNESIVSTKETILRLSMEIEVLQQVLEDTSTSTQAAQSVERETVDAANSQTLEFEHATNAVERVRRAVAALEKEKVELQAQIEASRDNTQQQLQETEDEVQKVKDLYEEEHEIKEAQKLLETETESLAMSLDEARKRVTVLQAQLESKASRKAMLQDEKLATEESVNKAQNECVCACNNIIAIRRRTSLLRQEEEKALRDLEYITSLRSQTLHSTLPRAFTCQLEAGGHRAEENLHQVVALRDRSLFTKARWEHRYNVVATSPPCICSDTLNSVDEAGANRSAVQRSASSTKTQRSLHSTGVLPPVAPTPSSKHSLDDHFSPCTAERESREGAMLISTEEPPSGMTSQIVIGDKSYSVTHPRSSPTSPPIASLRGSSSETRCPATLPTDKTAITPLQESPSSLNGKGKTEVSPVIERINLRLQEILNRTY
ncbi:hypothetical protein TraAM80_03401 [Trypanosoma rangeli]|uniref:Uncharacterized protein n=1 Tax=Trypanosoma rangeli TaxID=5698 RepID=A0A3R7MK53_TRYRA|nr:uncharacterized protein TraAM80_03401 [Trypanosoma rangeli]RNF07278.1 hypothetical protein TraAM80_03401 [Trypanosoma rangeli]|eukprot:RNF07278.1 hypothetical protein TraAM80_03401 [Trypanosoma rangeli]